jgi:hypothetical protein
MVFGFLFERRTWAIHVVERIYPNIRVKEATLAIEMIIILSKRAGVSLPKRDTTILSAICLLRDNSSIEFVTNSLGVSNGAAVKFLDEIRSAAIELARENGLVTIAEQGDRDRQDYLAGRPLSPIPQSNLR